MKHLQLMAMVICISAQAIAQAPVFDWAKVMLGTNGSYGSFITSDAAGNVYTTGNYTDTTDFDPGTGTYYLATALENTDIFVSKLDASGNFVWAKSMGGINSGDDFGLSITIDSFGNVYVTGSFTYTADFDPGPGIYNLTSGGWNDIFIAKLNSSGNFIWVKQIGAISGDVGTGIVPDATGDVYITGYFGGTVDFDPGAGTFNLMGGSSNSFICKLDASGNFVWAKCLGVGTGNSSGNSIMLDGLGNIYTTGLFSGTGDFDPSAGVFNLTSAGINDIFVSKLNSSGNFTWAKSMGGSDTEVALSLTMDGLGNVYTSGYFKGTSDFDPSPGIVNLTSAGDRDIFISALDSAGNFIWAKRIGGIYVDEGYSISADGLGNVYTTGNFEGMVDFDPGAGTFYLNPIGTFVAFILKLNSSGNFEWAGCLDGGIILAHSIYADSGGNIYTTGGFKITIDFDPDTAIFYLSAYGHDAFVHKMHPSPTVIFENNITDEFKLFPNPTNRDFTIQTGKQYNIVTVRVFNITGQEVFNTAYHNTNTMNVTLDAPPGIYLVEVKNSEGRIGRMKVIKV